MTAAHKPTYQGQISLASCQRGIINDRHLKSYYSLSLWARPAALGLSLAGIGQVMNKWHAQLFHQNNIALHYSNARNEGRKTGKGQHGLQSEQQHFPYEG